MKSPGVNPHINGQMIFDNTAKAIHGEDTFSTSGWKVDIHRQKNEVEQLPNIIHKN